MRIVFEGMERCGKDTMIKRLQDSDWLFNMYNVVHDTGPGKNATYNDAKTYIAIKSLELQTSKDTIFNRCFISDPIWGNLFRRYTNKKLITSLPYPDDLKIIILIARPDIVLARDDGKSMTTDVDKLIALYGAYKDLANTFLNQLYVDTLLIDISDLTEDDIFQEIQDFLLEANDKMYSNIRSLIIKADRNVKNIFFKFEPYRDFYTEYEPGCFNVDFMKSLFDEAVNILLADKDNLDAKMYFTPEDNGLVYSHAIIQDETLNILAHMSSVDIDEVPKIVNRFIFMYKEIFCALKVKYTDLNIGHIYLYPDVIYIND
jgi:hypothetical protein